jgi:predicted small secreted protein
MKTKPITAILLTCGALFVAGCNVKSTGRSELTASGGGRDIHVVADGGAWVGPAEDKFTVKLRGHEVVIEKERLLVDQQERAKLPAGVKKFEVSFEAGALLVSGDGTEIFKAALTK